MPKFNIKLCRSMYQYGTVFVEAETEEDAIEMIEQDLDDAWSNATIDDEIYPEETTVQDWFLSEVSYEEYFENGN